MEEPRILVTGGTGFVGRHLVRALLDDGRTVRVLARDPDAAADLKAAGAEVVRGDLLEKETLPPALDGCTHVYHLAAQMLREGKKKEDYFRINVTGTANLASAAVMAGSVERFVYGSTAGVYGIITDPPVDEESPLALTSGYRESKRRGEEVCLAAFEEEGLPVVVARLSPMIGPGSTSYVGLCRALLAGGFRTIGDGKNRDHITVVDDIVQGLHRCADTPGIEGETYLIAGDTATPTDEVLRLFAEAAGAPPVAGRLPAWPFRLYNAGAEWAYAWTGAAVPRAYHYAFFLTDKVLSTEKAKRELGFAPERSLASGIDEAVRWYRAEGLL
ncbi:NAD-dependent epimerase/dehydratase family protein [Parvularcula dongshanensis]|uniref:Nucleoside-diphosphate-sugar epimerase n=1 Tax=Parvularcula dongshanensis TaxID=1173995 RepID=A0A840I5E6_9PROT|nr:nucleoside-diphosphate-sugar epimerase [Parvularcula dongshanensis]